MFYSDFCCKNLLFLHNEGRRRFGGGRGAGGDLGLLTARAAVQRLATFGRVGALFGRVGETFRPVRGMRSGLRAP